MKFSNKSLAAIAILSLVSVTTNSFSISPRSSKYNTRSTCSTSASSSSSSSSSNSFIGSSYPSIFVNAVDTNDQYCTNTRGGGRSSTSTSTSMTASTSATSTTTTTQSSPAPRVGKFQSDVYDKPVVLIGTSTVKNELTKLALSFASSVTNGFDSDKDIDIKGKSKTDVVLLDLSTINDNDNDKMAQAKDRIQQFYNQDYLVIYINVQNQNNNNNDDDLEKLLIDNSDYELCIKPDDTDDTPIVDLEDPSLQLSTPWDNMEWQFQRLLARAFLPLATPGSTSSSSTNTAHLTMGSNTFFLSLSFPKITDAEPFLEAMCQDVDAMEFRTDLLDCRNDRFEVMHSLQKLRELCRSHATRAPMLPLLGEVIDDSLPVCYTVRTENQAGTFPDDQVGIGQMFDLLELGLRAGVEVLDVESAWNKERTDGILKLVEDRYASQILGSHHVVGRKVTDEEAVEFYRKCALNGRAHGAKVVLSIEEEKDDHQALHAGEAARKIAQEKGEPMIPHIGLILGDVGKYSRVLNIPYTPVTHESLPFVAAPGQMTASQLMTTRFIMGLVPPMKYGILGHNISYSVSPAMQGAAFAAVGLPHSYVLIDMADVEEFVTSDIWKDEVFGGCSVTIPHKQAIIPHLDQLTDAARAIGAVNTVIVKKPVDGEVGSTRTLIGDNTDWRGIFNPLNRQLGSSSAKNDKIGVALILGGGGTARAAAYAATQLGLEKIYYNRTPSKAQDLADSFGGTVAMNMNGEGADSLGSILEGMNGEARVVISTLPAAAGFELPSWFVDNVKDGDGDRKPIIFDVNYKPFWTNLLHQADGHEFPLVRGSEMLWEQGVGQFELWTGRTAPYKVMKSVVLRNCLPEEEEEEE